MKSNQLKKIIQRLVAEEVKKQIGEIFISEIKSKKSTPIQESVKTEEVPTLGGKTFTSNDMASLLGYGDMKPNGGGMTNQGVAEIAQKAGVAQVDPDVQKAVTKDYSELMNLYGSCDALISLHRSEGFGRIIVECINLGLEIISTNWGGNTDFCSVEFTHLVPYKKIDVIPGTYPFWEGQKWAEPDLDKAAEYIYDIYKGKRLNKKNFRKKIRNQFSLENTGHSYSQRIKEIIENLS